MKTIYDEVIIAELYTLHGCEIQSETERYITLYFNNSFHLGRIEAIEDLMGIQLVCFCPHTIIFRKISAVVK